MIHASDIFVFLITIFIALTFTNAGLYLTDELSPANQLHQLGEGHQLTYHEENYGFYEDGVDKYITGANYVMIYSLMESVISLPIYTIISLFPDASRLMPLIFWIFVLVSIITTATIYYREKLNTKVYYFYSIAFAAISLNIFYYTPFNGNYEVIAIVMTNMLLYGLFGVMVWKFINYMFCGNNKRIFMWIATMSCTSLLFWVGVLKDHVIIALLFIIIVYSIVKFYDLNDTQYLMYSGVASGLIIWERPELSIAIIPLICLILLFKFKKYALQPLFTYGICTSIFMLPSLLNNYIVTGSVFKFPFQAVNQTVGGAHFISSNNVIDVLLNEIPSFILTNLISINIENFIGIMIYPANGAVGILPIIMISIFVVILLPYFVLVKKIELIAPEKLLYIFSFVITITYLFTSILGFNLHYEKGILPDMRYFSLVYATFMISSLSVISRIYILNYQKLIKNFIIWFGIMLIAFTVIISIISNGVMSTPNANLTANIIGLIVFAISTAIIIDVVRTNRESGLETILPIMISLPLVWQIYTAVITTKLYSSPMFIPMIEMIKKVIFG